MVSSKQLIQAAAGAATEPEGAWDLTYSHYALTGKEWNATSPQLVWFKDVTAQRDDGDGIFLKPDGTKLFFCSRGSQRVYEYNLTTPFMVSTASFVAARTLPSPHDWYDIFFSDDGTRVFTATTNGDEVRAWNLSTAWDLTTASFVASKYVGSQDTGPWGIFFKPDGTKMYVSGTTNNRVYEYNLSTPWNITTATYSQFASVNTPRGLFFKSDGTVMLTVSSFSVLVSYTLSTPWDISTASANASGSVRITSSNNSESKKGVWVSPDGSLVYTITQNTSNSTCQLTQHNIGTLYVAPDTNTLGIQFSSSGDKFYSIGSAADRVWKVDPAAEYDISSTSNAASYLVSSQEATPEDLFFKPDGTKMYVVGSSGDEVNEYSLSTAWDVTTATPISVFSVSAQDSQPKGIFFKDDGTKMYIAGATSARIYEYNLSTAWDITTATLNQSLFINANASLPEAVIFKPDGTKMFIASQGKGVVGYDLSTAWDISTASYVATASVNPHMFVITGLTFKPDGTKYWVVYQRGVRAYNLSPQT